MGNPLPTLKKGSFPSLIDTATANRLIEAINGLRSMIIAPAGAGKMVVGESGVTMDLSGLIALVTKNQTAQSAITQTTSPGQPGVPGGGVPGGGGGGGGALNTKINGVINALNAAAINAVCNSDGSISVTLVIPGLPPAT